MTAPRQPPWGYPPPPAPPAVVLPKESYTRWVTRLCAFLIDAVPAVLLMVISSVVGSIADGCSRVRADAPHLGHCGWAVADNGGILLLLGFGLAFGLFPLTLAYLVWNFGYRQGKTGSSIGKSVMKFKVVGEKTWQPIGFWLSLVRQLMHWLDQMACYIGFLWPLWDYKRQTFADKIMGTVCVPVDSEPPPAPLYQPAGYPWPG